MAVFSYRGSPTLRKFALDDDSFVRGLKGPFGSGKSSACVMEIVRRAHLQQPGPDGIRRSRWLVVRNTYPQLRDTTTKTFLDWIPEGVGNRLNRASHEYRVGAFAGVECEVLFRALDREEHTRNLLSLELTGAWVNEAREIPEGIISGIIGRLGRFPSQRDGGPTWSGLILDTNPPDRDSWWYRRFEVEKPNGWRGFNQPSGLSEDAENLGNLPKGYYQRLAETNGQEWVKVYVHGEYGWDRGSTKAVFPEFRESIHVAPVSPIKGREILVGLDFGLSPAAVYLQLDAFGRWNVLGELVASDSGIARFGQNLRLDLSQRFPGHAVRIIGDPAGEQRAQTDEITPFQVLRQVTGLPATPAHSNSLTLRLEAVKSSLSDLVDGRPRLLIHPDALTLRGALGGKYCYRKLGHGAGGDEKYSPNPEKGPYSHVADALQYALLGGGEGLRVTGAGSKTMDYVPPPVLDWRAS